MLHLEVDKKLIDEAEGYNEIMGSLKWKLWLRLVGFIVVDLIILFDVIIAIPTPYKEITLIGLGAFVALDSMYRSNKKRKKIFGENVGKGRRKNYINVIENKLGCSLSQKDLILIKEDLSEIQHTKVASNVLTIVVSLIGLLTLFANPFLNSKMSFQHFWLFLSYFGFGMFLISVVGVISYMLSNEIVNSQYYKNQLVINQIRREITHLEKKKRNKETNSKKE